MARGMLGACVAHVPFIVRLRLASVVGGVLVRGGVEVSPPSARGGRLAGVPTSVGRSLAEALMLGVVVAARTRMDAEEGTHARVRLAPCLMAEVRAVGALVALVSRVV